jgi:copper chaperone CopZ
MIEEGAMIRLDVPRMSSEKCRASVMGAVMGIDPKARCDVDLDTGRLAVESHFPPSDFIEALEEIGYASFIAQV